MLRRRAGATMHSEARRTPGRRSPRSGVSASALLRARQVEGCDAASSTTRYAGDRAHRGHGPARHSAHRRSGWGRDEGGRVGGHVGQQTRGAGGDRGRGRLHLCGLPVRLQQVVAHHVRDEEARQDRCPGHGFLALATYFLPARTITVFFLTKSRTETLPRTRASASTCSFPRPATSCRPPSPRCACPWCGTRPSRRPTAAASSSCRRARLARLRARELLDQRQGRERLRALALADLEDAVVEVGRSGRARAATIVTRPLRVSTIVPTGICCPSVELDEPVGPGELDLTVPALGTTLTFLPATGCGSSSSGGGCGPPPGGGAERRTTRTRRCRTRRPAGRAAPR